MLRFSHNKGITNLIRFAFDSLLLIPDPAMIGRARSSMYVRLLMIL